MRLRGLGTLRNKSVYNIVIRRFLVEFYFTRTRYTLRNDFVRFRVILLYNNIGPIRFSKQPKRQFTRNHGDTNGRYCSRKAVFPRSISCWYNVVSSNNNMHT